MRRKQLFIVSGLFIGVILLIIVLISPKSSLPSNLVSTDIVAANLQFTHELNQSQDDKLTFFTGSSIARLNLAPGTTPSSERLFDDLALSNVSKLSRSDSATVVRLFYSRSDSLLALDDNNPAVKTLKDGQNWFVIDNQAKIRPLSFVDQAGIVDCIIEGDDIYALVNQSNGKQGLLKHNLASGKTSTLLSDYSATSFVGIKKGIVVVRDFKGNVAIFKNGSVKQVEQNVGEALFDNVSGKVVLSRVEPGEAGEEGGVPSQSSPEQKKPKDYELVILDVVSEQRKQVTIPTSLLFVSKGYVLSVPSLKLPSSINTYNLVTGDSKTIQIDQSNTRAEDQIKNLVIVSRDLALIAAVTNFNQLTLYGNQDFVKGIPEYSIPLIEQSPDKFGFDHNLATDKLDIYFSEKNERVVKDSVLALQEICQCDANQVNKEWKATASSPGE